MRGKMLCLGPRQDFPPGAQQVICISDDDEVLVLNVAGTIYAVSNICPHAGAALERGFVRGRVLFCPLHQWGFLLESGACLNDTTYCVRTYTVEIRDEQLMLLLP